MILTPNNNTEEERTALRLTEVNKVPMEMECLNNRSILINRDNSRILNNSSSNNKVAAIKTRRSCPESVVQFSLIMELAVRSVEEP